jgi:hypothetical protein
VPKVISHLKVAWARRGRAEVRRITCRVANSGEAEF